MRVPWIRVHGGLYNRPVVDRLCQATGINEHEAVGVLVTFWSGVAAHATNGRIDNVSNSQLEKWANWSTSPRRRGLFAAWVREQHQDAEGRVPEWDDYAGALELRREKERVRLSERRQRLRDATQNVAQQTQDVATRARERDGTVRDGTERDSKSTDKSPSLPRARKPRTTETLPTWVQTIHDVWLDKIGAVEYGRLGKALKAIVAKHSVEGVIPAIEVYASADEGPKNGVRSVNHFAGNFQHWHRIAQTPLVDAHGVLTERGKRVGAL